MQFQLYLKSHEIYESAQKVIQKIMKFDWLFEKVPSSFFLFILLGVSLTSGISGMSYKVLTK